MNIRHFLQRFASALLLATAALAAPFILIYLMGVIGTAGREATGEFGFMLLVCGVSFAGGLALWRAAGPRTRG